MSEQVVKRRHVFYLPGYDPFHPRRYRELYRREARKQAQISGYEISVLAKSGTGPFGWQVSSRQDGAIVNTGIEVLIWHDIVQASMSQSVLSTYFQLLQTAYLYIGSGALFRLMKLRKGPMIAALYPVVVLLGQLAVASVSGGAIYQGLSSLVPESMFLSTGFALISLAVCYAILEIFRRFDGKLFAHYLMHDYAFTAREGGAIPTVLKQRLRQFEDRIQTKLNEELDEVLVIGHSSGAHLGVSVLANLLRKDHHAAIQAELSFLTLGQAIPMVSFLPKAKDLRSDLHVMGKQDRITWIDVTAPADGCAFALCDPVAVSGVATEQSSKPLVLSAAFSKTLSKEMWDGLRWNFIKRHFQYLCAFDRPGRYDYFRITAGPKTLANRFRGQNPSASRITSAVNGYSDVDL